MNTTKPTATPVQKRIRDIASGIIGARPKHSDKLTHGRKLTWEGDSLQQHTEAVKAAIHAEYPSVEVQTIHSTVPSHPFRPGERLTITISDQK